MAIPEAQIYHYRARAYDPMMGRFLQTDPIRYGDGPNIYAYTHGDPVNGTDPSGTFCDDAIGYGVACFADDAFSVGVTVSECCGPPASCNSPSWAFRPLCVKTKTGESCREILRSRTGEDFERFTVSEADALTGGR